MKGLLFFVILLGIGIVLWMTSQKDGFQDLELPSAYGDMTPSGASPSLNVPVVTPKQQFFTGGSVQPFAPPSTALLAPPPGQAASVNTKPDEDPALQKAKIGRIQSVYESMNGFFQTAEAGLQKLGDPSVQLPLTTARGDRSRLKDEMAVLLRNPGLESGLTEEDLSGIEANLAYLQRKWNMSVNAESGAPPEGFESGSGRWSLFGWLFGEEEGFQAPAGSSYSCPLQATQNGGYYQLNGSQCIEQCPAVGFARTVAGTCKNSTTGVEYTPSIIPATLTPNTPATEPTINSVVTAATDAAKSAGATKQVVDAIMTAGSTPNASKDTMIAAAKQAGASTDVAIAAVDAASNAAAPGGAATAAAPGGAATAAAPGGAATAAAPGGAATAAAPGGAATAAAPGGAATAAAPGGAATAAAPTRTGAATEPSTATRTGAPTATAAPKEPSTATPTEAPKTNPPVAGTNSDATLTDIGALITKIDIEIMRLGKYTGDY